MKIAVLALTSGGRKLAAAIVEGLNNAHLLDTDKGVFAALAANWPKYDGFVCIMAAGIVVRGIAPLLVDKKSDPCVVVLDEQGRHAVSLLSGHLGGGNVLAKEVSLLSGGTAVITTSSDTQGLAALDLWAREQQLVAADNQIFTKASSLLVNSGSLRVYCDTDVDSLPPGLSLTSRIEEADLVISNRLARAQVLAFHPRNLVVGVGCNRNTPRLEFEEALTELFAELQLSTHSIRNLSSIDVKNDETGLLEFADNHGWPIEFFSSSQINTITTVTKSDAAFKAVGAIGVAEPTALLSAHTSTLLSRKRKWQNITMAVAAAPFTLSAQEQAHLII